MAVRRKGRQYQADFMVSGERHRKSFATEAEAEAWEMQTRAAIKLGKPLPSPGPKSLGGRDAGTIGALVRDASRLHWGPRGAKQAMNAEVFARFVGENTPAVGALSQQNINEFLLHLDEDRHVSSSTKNRYRSAISVLAKRADIPMPKWKREREGQGRVRFFSEEEEQLIFQTLTLWGMVRERDYITFLIDTGCRPFSEGTQVRWEDINGRLLTIHGQDEWGTKNGESRSIPLTVRAMEAMQRQRHLGEAGPWTSLTKSHMRSVWDRLRAHLPQLRDTVLYTCRHTCASRLVQRGLNLPRVQLWMGHKTVQMTQRYSHLTTHHLMDAVELLEAGPTARFKLVRAD